MILLPERQLPHLFPGELGGLTDLPFEIVVRSHHADHVIAQGHDTCPRQGRQVDDRGGLVTAGVGQGVCEDQASFGVGRHDLDRLAREGFENITRFVRLPARQVFRRRYDPDQIHRQAELRRGPDGRNHRRPARHVRLHLVHLIGRLDGDPTAVEGDPLTDQGDDRTRLLPPAVFEYDQLRRLVASPGHAQEGIHPEFLHLAGIEHRTADVLPLGAFSGLVRKIGRGHLIRRRGNDIPRKGGRGGDDFGRFRRGPDNLVSPLFRRQDRKPRDLAALFPIDGLERQKLVKTEDNPFYGGLRHPFERKIYILDVQRCRKLADVQGTDVLRGPGECPPQTIRREIRSLPQPHDDDPLDRKILTGVENGNLVRQARKITPVEDLFNQTATPFIQQGGNALQPGFALEEGHDRRFGRMLRQAAFSDLNLHVLLRAGIIFRRARKKGGSRRALPPLPSGGGIRIRTGE